MQDKKYDTCVIGGGPAGATCAEFLGKNGINVALFDDSHPREKPCGGGVSAKVIKRFNIPESIADRISERFIIGTAEGNVVEIPAHEKHYLVMREKFDQFLIKRAAEYSEHFSERVIDIKLQEMEWIIKTNKRKIYCKNIVGADGVSSLVRKKLSRPIPKQDLAMGMGYHLSANKTEISKRFNPPAFELYFYNDKNRYGYCWIFPKGEYITVGLGEHLSEKKLNDKLEWFLNSSHMKSRIQKYDKTNFHAHLIPFIRTPKFFDEKISGKNWGLIGDAAGHVNPLTGEGISYGMIGGELLAKNIANNTIENYEKEWRTEFGNTLKLGSSVQKYFYDKNIVDLTVKICQRSNTAKKFIEQIVDAQEQYANLLAPHKLAITIAKSITEYALH